MKLLPGFTTQKPTASGSIFIFNNLAKGALLRLIILFSLLLLLINTSIANTEKEPPLYKIATLAGGCFWCIEADFEQLNGVVNVVSGYTGGHIKNPRYSQVSAGRSGHIEAVEVTYDPNIISYSQILNYFWRHIDPTRNDGQFCDKGLHYRPAIFYNNNDEKKIILQSARHIEETKTFSEPLKVEYIKAQKFYLAEEYHQDYYKKNPLRYKYYRYACGRDTRIKFLWGK
jgi:peptide methionine sulfoxide reductase msrA/msrB